MGDPGIATGSSSESSRALARRQRKKVARMGRGARRGRRRRDNVRRAEKFCGTSNRECCGFVSWNSITWDDLLESKSKYKYVFQIVAKCRGKFPQASRSIAMQQSISHYAWRIMVDDGHRYKHIMRDLPLVVQLTMTRMSHELGLAAMADSRFMGYRNYPSGK
jgi:hypothetical protein